MDTDLSPFVLEGEHVCLEPLQPGHAALLWEIAKDDLADLFQWIPYRLESLKDFEQFNQHVLDEQARGLSLPFATYAREGSQIVGTTR